MNNVSIFLVDYFKANKNNGLNTYVNELGKGLIKNNRIELSYVWINSNYPEVLRTEVDGACHFYIPKFIPEKDTTINFDIYIADILSQEIAAKEKTIIHLNWINHCSIGWHLKQRTDCRIILTKHCIPWKDYASSNYKEFYRLNNALNKKQKVGLQCARLQQEQINYEYIDHIITVTNCAKENLELLFNVNKETISTISNGITLNIPKNNAKIKAKLRREYGFNEDEKILFFAGTLSLTKGVVDLIKIFEEFLEQNKTSNLRLVIAGGGNTSILVLASKKYWARITITGNLDKPTLYKFYQMSDIGIVPSYIEQCSYSAIEMMQFGLPIIVSDVDGLREIVPDGIGLRIKVDFKKAGVSVNSNDLCQKLTLLLKNKDYAKQLATNAKKHAFETFNLQKMVDRTIGVYDKVLEEKKREQGVFEPASSKLKNADMPLITILMPSYNGGPYLKSCIDSVLNQSYTHFEFLIIDDGSTDNTFEIIKGYTDKRIRILLNKENKGITHSLNKGLKLANGKYIARIDADDIMLPNRLALQVEFLEQNPSYGMVGAWHEVIDAYGRVITRVQPNAVNEQLKLQLLFNNPFAHAAVTMRTELVRQFKYDKKFAYCEDFDLWTKIASVAKTTNLPHYLLQYRVHSKNSSGNNSKVMRRNVMLLLSRELDKIHIFHSVDELAIHMAISFGYGKVYFNSEEKIEKLKGWLNKLFSADELKKQCGPRNLTKFKKHVLTNYCYIN